MVFGRERGGGKLDISPVPPPASVLISIFPSTFSPSIFRSPLPFPPYIYLSTAFPGEGRSHHSARRPLGGIGDKESGGNRGGGRDLSAVNLSAYRTKL